jgi:hypothetical protein
VGREETCCCGLELLAPTCGRGRVCRLLLVDTANLDTTSRLDNQARWFFSTRGVISGLNGILRCSERFKDEFDAKMGTYAGSSGLI